MLTYIRVLVPHDIKSEILEGRHKVLLKNSVELCKLSSCYVSLVVAFERFIGQSLLQKFLF